MKFKNPSNGYIETANAAWFWVLLFGCFYFAVKGVWAHVLISAALAIATSGVSWFIYPLFAPGIMRRYYLKNGWIEVV